MKKKFLSIGIIAILVVMLFILTGCGNEEKTNNKQGSLTSNNPQTTETNKQKEEISVKEVKAISENYAVVIGADNKTYIIDKDGNYQGSIELTKGEVLSNVKINKNGYVVVKEEAYNTANTVYDKTGKLLFKGSMDEKYSFGITDNNLLIKDTLEKNFSGNNRKLEVIDINGNVKGTIPDDCKDVISGEYLRGEYFLFYSNENLYMFDVNTCKSSEMNKILKFDKNEYSAQDYSAPYSIGGQRKSYIGFVADSDFKDYKQQGRIINNNVWTIDNTIYMNNNNQLIQLDSYDVLLSDKEYYCANKKAICDYNGNVVKDLSEGGVAQIGYYNNKYYIESSTGFFYILDSNYNRILEPTEMSVYDINSYGMYGKGTGDNTIVYSLDNIENKKELSYKLTRDPKYFIAEVDGKQEYFNLNTQEKLVIYK